MITHKERVALASKLGLVLVVDVGRRPVYLHDDQNKPKVRQYARVFYPREPERSVPRSNI